MDEEEKDLITLYADDKPLCSASPAEWEDIEMEGIPPISYEGDETLLGRTVRLEGTIDMERMCAAVETVTKAWDAIAGTFREAVDTITELWRAIAAESVKEWMEKKAIAWADQNRRDLAGRYHHTKKRRIRKKYRKRIVEAYLEGVMEE